MAGEPASPSNCTVANITANTLEVSCLEGYDGGLPQIFVLQVLAVKSEKLVANLTSSTGPHFTVHALEAATPYEMNIWAQNAKGNSPSVVLMAETYVSAIQIDEYFKYLFLPKNEHEETQGAQQLGMKQKSTTGADEDIKENDQKAQTREAT